jgi:hypothetical protein
MTSSPVRAAFTTLTVVSLGVAGAFVPSVSQASQPVQLALAAPASTVETTAHTACSTAGQITVVVQEPAEGNIAVHVSTRGLEPGRWVGAIIADSADYNDNHSQSSEVDVRTRDGSVVADAEFDPTYAHTFTVILLKRGKFTFCAAGITPRKPLVAISLCRGIRSVGFFAFRKAGAQLALHALSESKPGSLATVSMTVASDGLEQTFDSQLVAGKHGRLHVKKVVDYVVIESASVGVQGPHGRTCQIDMTQGTSVLPVTRAPLAQKHGLRGCSTTACSRLDKLASHLQLTTMRQTSGK